MEGGYKIAYARRDGLLGAGLYSAKMSSKSVAYAKNIETAEDSRYKAIMVNAVSLGRTIDTDRWFKYLKEVPDGYNSVHGVCHTQFGSDELVVYNEDALRPAFLIICDNVKVRTFPDVDTPAELALSQWVSKWLDNKVSVADYIEGLESNPHAAELEAIRVGAEVEMCVDTAHDVRQEVGGFCEEIEEIGHSIRSWWKSSR
ncbi:hypothetical protein FRB97_001156 [Tulasnella sp. 331]|nr:hypothetical protein FRB97_001156 [Tulasnella sp. 331]